MVCSLTSCIHSQLACHHFLYGDSSVHSNHSFPYSKTLPPHFPIPCFLKKRASVHWSAPVGTTTPHLCKLNEVIVLQLICVSQGVGVCIPHGLAFSREAWELPCPVVPQCFFTPLYLAFSLDYDNTSPIYLTYSSPHQVSKLVCKNTLASFCQSTHSSKRVSWSQRPKPCLWHYLRSQILIQWVRPL